MLFHRTGEDSCHCIGPTSYFHYSSTLSLFSALPFQLLHWAKTLKCIGQHQPVGKFTRKLYGQFVFLIEFLTSKSNSRVWDLNSSSITTVHFIGFNSPTAGYIPNHKREHVLKVCHLKMNKTNVPCFLIFLSFSQLRAMLSTSTYVGTLDGTCFHVSRLSCHYGPRHIIPIIDHFLQKQIT